MSVINQLLIDLDRRRASAPERGALPGHVRALPQNKDPARTWRVGGMLGIALLATVAAVLSFPQLKSIIGSRDHAAADPAARPAADTSGVAADAGAVSNSTSRMSLELSMVPDSRPVEAESRPRQQSNTRIAPIATGGIVGSPPGDSGDAAQGKPVAPPAKPADRGEAARDLARAGTASKPEFIVEGPGEIDKRSLKPTPRDLAETDYARGISLMQQGRTADAREALESALRRHPQHHGARQALLGVLIESRQHAEAERLLQEGLRLSPSQTGFSMALARLQVERGDGGGGVETLLRGLDAGRGNPDYLGFLAALLQRQQRHAEAVEHFQSALRLRPQHGVWLLGMGVSLQSMGRAAEAQDAFQRAKSTGSLSPELQAFADQRLRQSP